MDIDALDKPLLAKSLNYHGSQLHKIFERDFPHFNVLKLDNLLNFNEYTKRQKQFSFQDRSKRLRLQQFICKNADKLFNKNNKSYTEVTGRSRSLDPSYYPILPPFEWFTDVDKELRLQRFFETIKEGDVIGATVLSKTSPGIILKVLFGECDEVRCVSDVGIKAFCPTSALIPAVEKKVLSSRAFLLNDFVLCEILEVNPDTEKIVCGMKGIRCQPENRDRLGLMLSEDFPAIFKKFQEKKKDTYNNLLEKSESFSNPDFVNNLMNYLDIPNELYSHFGYLKEKFPTNECASELRILQAAKWSFRNVAEGIEHFKAQRYTEAFQCLNKALTIDPRNIEALVARGALYANSSNYGKAIADFESALKLNPNHQNAKKYLGDTLIAHGRAYEEQEKFTEAMKAYEHCLKLLPNHEEARNSLQFIKNKIIANSKKTDDEKESASSKKMQEINTTLSQLLAQTDEKHLLREIKKLKKKRATTSSSSSSSSNSSSDTSDDSDSSSSSSDTGKKKKKSKKEHSLSPLSKRMAQMESVAGQETLLPSSYQNVSAYLPSTVSYEQGGSMPFYQSNLENENEYELRVKKFLSETKRDDDYEEKVRKFLEESEKWKKKHEQKKEKSRKKEKSKSKKRKKDSKKKKRKKEKKHKKRSRESSEHKDAIPEKYLNPDNLEDFDDLESKLTDYYSKVEKASNKIEDRDETNENLENSSHEAETNYEGDAHDQLSRSIHEPNAESFEEDHMLPEKLETSMIKFKMQMPTSQSKLQKRSSEDPFWEEEKNFSEDEEKENSSKVISTDLDQIQLPAPPRPAESPGPLDKLRGFHMKKMDSPPSKRNGRDRSKSRSRSGDRRSRYRSRSQSKKRYRSRSRSRSSSYRRRRYSRYSRSRSNSRSRSRSRSRSYGRRHYKGRGSYYRHRGSGFRPYRGYRGRNRPYSPRRGGYRPYNRSHYDRDDRDYGKHRKRSPSSERKWRSQSREKSVERNRSDDEPRAYTPEEIPIPQPIDLPDTLPPGVDADEPMD